MECPTCGTVNSLQATRCSECGYEFAEDHARELHRTTEIVQQDPTDAWAWIEYADALYRNKRLQEARSALDRSLLHFHEMDWQVYNQAAASYELLGDSAFAARLLADGLLYHLDNHRDYLDPEEIRQAGRMLRIYANNEAIRKFNQQKPEDRHLTRMAHETVHGVSFSENPRPDLDGLGTYELATSLGSHPDRRLYPGSAQMNMEAMKAKRKAQKQQESKQSAKKAIIIAVAIIVLGTACSCLVLQCMS